MFSVDSRPLIFDSTQICSPQNERLVAAHQFCLSKKRIDLHPTSLLLPCDYEYDRGSNPFITIKFDPDQWKDDVTMSCTFFGGKGGNKETCVPTYYAMFDEEAFCKVVDRKNNASNHLYIIPLSKVYKCTYKELEVIMTHLIRKDDGSLVSSHNGKGSIMDEKFYDYLINLNTLPVLIPVSPIVLLLVRPLFRKPYDISTLSFCILKTLFQLALNDKRAGRSELFVKKVKENLMINVGKVIDNYEECLSGACCYYAHLLEKQAAAMCVLPSIWKEMIQEKKMESIKEYEKKVELALDDFKLRFEETIHRYWIDLINVYECACINLYLYDYKTDENKGYENFCDWEVIRSGTSNSFWSNLLTKNMFKPFPKFTWDVTSMSLESRRASKTRAFNRGICNEPQKREKQNLVSRQVLSHYFSREENRYMIGREVKEDIKSVQNTQTQYLNCYEKEYGKNKSARFDVAKEFDGRFPTLFEKNEILETTEDMYPFCISAQNMARFMDIQLNSMVNDFDEGLVDGLKNMSLDKHEEEKSKDCDLEKVMIVF